MRNLYQNLFIRNPDSMGDILVANGIYHHFIEKATHTIMGINDTFYPVVKCLYQDFPTVKVLNLEEFEALKLVITDKFILPKPRLSEMPIQFGDGSSGSLYISWDRQYYESYDLPISMRYRNFKMPKCIEGADELYDELTQGEKDYIIVNRHMGGNPVEKNMSYIPYTINHFNPQGYKEIEIDPMRTTNPLQYVKLFKHAKQIHVLPTSFHQLIDCMIDDIEAELLVFHNARRNFYCSVNNYYNNYRWAIIEYQQRF